MELRSIRTFIGAKDFKTSQSFYKDLGFTENFISEKMSLFTFNHLSFYLQDYFVQDWLDNSMVLAEVDSVEEQWIFLKKLELDTKYAGVQLIPIQQNDWGKECLLIDPSGVLWHFAEFQ